MRKRLAAARHEVQCDECRSSWLSWTQRLLGIRRGYSPCNRRILRTVQAQREALRDERDGVHEALRWLVHEVYESTGRLSMGADLVVEQDRLLQAAGIAEQSLPIPLRYDPERDAEVMRLLAPDAASRAPEVDS